MTIVLENSQYERLVELVKNTRQESRNIRSAFDAMRGLAIRTEHERAVLETKLRNYTDPDPWTGAIPEEEYEDSPWILFDGTNPPPHLTPVVLKLAGEMPAQLDFLTYTMGVWDEFEGFFRCVDKGKRKPKKIFAYMMVPQLYVE